MDTALQIMADGAAVAGDEGARQESLAGSLREVGQRLDHAHALALATGKCDQATCRKFADINERLERMLSAVRFRAA